MTTEYRALPPTPWAISPRTTAKYLLDIIDAQGKRVVTVWGYTQKRREAIAHLIIRAANEAAFNTRMGSE
jgi:hypothetical protein